MKKQKFPVMAVGIFMVTSNIALLGGCEKKESTPKSMESATPPMSAPAPSMTESGAAATTPMSDAEVAMKKSDCFTCHTVDKKLVGPPYEWVAYRFKDDKDAVAKLTKAIKEGSSGKWTAYTNGVPMTPHPQLTDAEIKSMVEWVLSQKPVEPPKS